MKKKIFLLFTAALCAAICAFGLVACKNVTGEVPNCNHAYILRYDSENHFEKCEKCGNIKNTQSHNLDETGHCNKCDYHTEVDKNYKKVSFEMNGGYGDVETMTFAVGELMTNLPTPKRDGFTFICWVDAFGVEYTAATAMPDTELLLVAKWEKIVTNYEDDYVSFSPASVGYKNALIHETYGKDVDTFVYVEITSDDLGGVSKVGTDNNFTLRTMESMEYKIKSGYTWAWFQGSFNNPNGAQRFTLRYGSNIQFVTISDSSGVVRQTYLLDIYVKHDYYINLYKNIFEEKPYDTVRVIENDRFSSTTIPFDYQNGFEFDKRIYFNRETEQYEDFVYSTAITSNWDLYQTYKPVTLSAQTDGGEFSNQLIITPFTQFFTLPSPVKEGYDFLGWQDKNGKYLTNIQGYSGVNYLSDKNYSETLKAVYAKKKFYYTFKNDTFTTVKTIPVVTYTDKTMTDILEIVYVPYNTDCVLPVKTAQKEGNIFTGWKNYSFTNGKFTNTLSQFDFNTKITAPVALAPETESVLGTSKVVPLNGEITSREKGAFRMYLPADKTYKLKISTTNSVTLTINKYGATNNSVTLTVTSDSPRTIDLDYYKYELGETVHSHGYVTFNVTELTGSFTAKLEGDTANTQGKPTVTDNTNTAAIGEKFTVPFVKRGYTFIGWYKGETKIADNELEMPSEEITYRAKWVKQTLTTNQDAAGIVTELSETYIAGEEVTITATTNLGYTWIGWYNNETLLTENLSYTFSMPSINTTFTAKWKVNDEMLNFNFTSTPTTCTITGVKDITNSIIEIPNYITQIVSNAFSNSNLLVIRCLQAQKPNGWSSNWNSSFPVIWDCETNDLDDNGYAYTIVNDLRYKLRNDVANLVNQSKNLAGEITIPEHVTYKNNIFQVTGIDSSAFINCKELKSIIIPNNVTNIGREPFHGCPIESATIPTSAIDYIPKSSLKTVIMTSGTSIKSSAFLGCSNLTSITIPNSVKDIESSAFSGCSGLTSITIPNSVTYIGSSAFSSCSGLTCITIPDSVTMIGNSVFSGCDTLPIFCEAVSKPNYWDVKWNSSDCPVIWNCKNNNETTDGEVYYCMDGLRYKIKDDYAIICRQSTAMNKIVIIPQTIKYNEKKYIVTHIDDYAFTNSRNLTSITMPNSITSIGISAFQYCNSLTNVVLSNNLKYIGVFAFLNCPNLQYSIYDNAKYIGSNNNSYYLLIDVLNKNISSCIIHAKTKYISYTCKPNQIASADTMAFVNCKNLNNITIPYGVLSIGASAFAECHNLKK